MDKNKKVILIVLDGWGYRKEINANAVALAKTPNFNKLWSENPHTHLEASGKYVGLPSGVIGNSEVGHTHLGAGRIIEQELVIINKAIENKSFFRNKALNDAIEHVKKKNSSLHLLGLLSLGGVHSHMSHLFALLKLVKEKMPEKRVYIHAILDGRDAPAKSAIKYIDMLEQEIKKLKIDAKIATIMGRYYGMDRDKRWHREHRAYESMVNKERHGPNHRDYKSAKEYLKKYYEKGISDEFIPPTITDKERVKENDSIIFFNFRGDRAREITKAFVQGKFLGFKRKKIINLKFVCLTQYSKKIKTPVAFMPEQPKNMLGEVISKKGMKQLRIAETEKYAHVTFFFNGGAEQAFEGEVRIVIPSRKVKTYDERPEMQADKITKNALIEIKNKKYDFILVNLANPDMVGHSGKLKETISAVETADKCMGKLVETARKNGYCAVVTADHGNAEEMCGKYRTSHTMNKVPIIIIDDEKYEMKINKEKSKANKEKSIANIAPTILKIMGIKKPDEMKLGEL